MGKIFLWIYRVFSQFIFGFGHRFSSRFPSMEPKKGRYWFHAASVGELETLWPIVKKVCDDENSEFILTNFSSSADSVLKKLELEILNAGRKVVFCGPAPAEGKWEHAILQLKPYRFVTAKYEAWPDLWASLSRCKVPLFIVSAMARPSLKVAKLFMKLFSMNPPLIHFLVVEKKDIAALREYFPDSEVSVTGEPRWDRVQERLRLVNDRARVVKEQIRKCPKPIGILGSVWPTDKGIITAWVREGKKGTLVVVPHELSEGILAWFRKEFESHGINISLAFRAGDFTNSQVILVNEYGILAELYEIADWVYVGGGFSKEGVHSTIEPASSGVPVGIGPSKKDRFPEISQLSALGQLTVLHNSTEMETWIQNLDFDKKAMYREKIRAFFGASDNVLRLLLA